MSADHEAAARAIHDVEAEHSWLVGEGRIGAWEFASDDLKALRLRQAIAAYNAQPPSPERDTEYLLAFAHEHGIAALLDHLGLDELGNELTAVKAERDACKAALEELAQWGANREQHAARSDLNRDEERGWNLALSGLERRARSVLAGVVSTREKDK